MTHLSLFSGIGGLDLAAHWAGFETVQFVERDQFCQRVLAKNFPGVPIHDDVTTFDGKQFAGQLDLVSAGFPCQPHSLAGKRKASGDERDLWGEVVRVLGESKPTWFLGENVAGLFSSESGHFFGRICNDLALLGYRVGWGSWKASDVGACHQRRRVFIVAYSERFRCGSGLRESGGQQPSGGRETWGQPETHGQGISTDAKHYGSPAGQIGRSTCEGKDEGRLLESEGCSTSNPDSERLERTRASSPAANSSSADASCVSFRNEQEPRPKCQTATIARNDGEEGHASDPNRKPRPQSGAPFNSVSGSGETWAAVSWGDWRPYWTRREADWQSWDVKPTVCMPDDGVSRRLATSQLKALGNAVCPQQAYPIMQAIAEVVK